MTLAEAILLLQKAVKYSAVPGQKHIDFSLVGAEDLPLYMKAMVVVNEAVRKGEISRDKLLSKIGVH